MAVPTIGRITEEIKRILDGGDSPVASNVSHGEIKLAVGQAINKLLKVDYLSVNAKMRETIPNGAILGLYESIAVEKWNKKSKCTLPIKPLKLPRNMGIWSVYPSGQPDKEYIPMQLGQIALVQSQKMINDLFGQTGYENYGMDVVFSKDITNDVDTVDMRLVIMDVSEYGDYDPLPILPEMEFDVKQMVEQMYSQEPVPDKIVDVSTKEQKGIPIKEQTQR
jgi:hypothetical protein